MARGLDYFGTQDEARSAAKKLWNCTTKVYPSGRCWALEYEQVDDGYDREISGTKESWDGTLANEAGLKRSANPYDKSDQKHTLWDNEYSEAELHANDRSPGSLIRKVFGRR